MENATSGVLLSIKAFAGNSPAALNDLQIALLLHIHLLTVFWTSLHRDGTVRARTFDPRIFAAMLRNERI